MTISPGEQVHARTDGLSRWGAIMLPVIELIQYASVLTGAPFTVPLAVQCWRPPRAAGRQLRRLHGAASGMAVTSPLLKSCFDQAGSEATATTRMASPSRGAATRMIATASAV